MAFSLALAFVADSVFFLHFSSTCQCPSPCISSESSIPVKLCDHSRCFGVRGSCKFPSLIDGVCYLLQAQLAIDYRLYTIVIEFELERFEVKQTVLIPGYVSHYMQYVGYHVSLGYNLGRSSCRIVHICICIVY